MATTIERLSDRPGPDQSLVWQEAPTIHQGECGEGCTFKVRPFTNQEDAVAIIFDGQITAVEWCQCGLSTKEHQDIARDMAYELRHVF